MYRVYHAWANGQCAYQYHSEVYVKYMILQLGYMTKTLAVIEVPTVSRSRPGAGPLLCTWAGDGKLRPSSAWGGWNQISALPVGSDHTSFSGYPTLWREDSKPKTKGAWYEPTP